MLRHALILAVSVAALIAAGGGRARATEVNGLYAISLAGIPIGQADLSGQVDTDAYRIKVEARLTGFATVVSNGRGAAQASGGVGTGRVLSNGYALTASNSEMTRTIQIGLSSGNVGAVRVEPPFEPKPDAIPIKDDDKRNVLDPVSALLMPMTASTPLNPANCNRTLPVFDGAQRFDVVLTYSATKTVASGSFNGPVLVCKARYIPVAGHRPLRKTTKFMADNRDMEAWLAPVEGTRMLLPYRISVKTLIGTAVIEAQSFEGMTASLRK